MKIVNLTPHPVTLLDKENNPALMLEPYDVAHTAKPRTESKKVTVDTAYIVSSLRGQDFPQWADVYVVNKHFRDGNGRVICSAPWITF